MSKFTLTVQGDTIAEIMSALAASLMAASVHAPGMLPASDDDDNGPVNTAAPAVDADGVPWNDQIHSSNKQMTDKGVWRRKRGIADNTYNTVTAQLKAQAGVNAVTAAAPAPAPTMPAMPPGMPTPTPQMPAMPTMPQAAPAPTPGATPFGEFMAKYSAAVSAGKVTQAELTSFINSMGVPDLPTLNTRPDVIEQLTAWMLQNGKL